MSVVEHEAHIQEAAVGERPYRMSWFDRLIDHVDSLPVPAWLFYLLALALFSVLNNVVFWLDGSQAVGTFDFVRTTDGFWMVYGLCFYHYLRRIAGKSLHVFEPALAGTGVNLDDLNYRFTRMPSRWGWVATLLGLSIAVISILTQQAELGITSETSAYATTYSLLNMAFSYACAFALFIQTIRQLRLITMLNRQATHIDLFELAPAHAFSRLTAVAGIALFLGVIVTGIQSQWKFDALYFVLTIIFGLAAFVVFLAPLLGMQSRLKEEKENLLSQLNQRLKSILDEVDQSLDAGELSGLGDLHTAINTLLKKQDILEKISTWPWDSGTLRRFGSTLLLPIVLWLITRLLENLF